MVSWLLRRAIRRRFMTGRQLLAAAARGFRDIKLFWKLLVPFVAMLLIIGITGAFLTVRYLSSRAETTLDDNLLQRSVSADSYVRDQELNLLEGERFAANLEGLPEAVAAHDQAAVARTLASAVALRKDLDVAAVTDTSGVGLVDYTQQRGVFTASSGGNWSSVPAVQRVLAGVIDTAGDKHTSLVQLADGTRLFLVAGPVKTDRVVGSVVVGIAAPTIASAAAGRAGGGVALYDAGGTLLGRSSDGTTAVHLDQQVFDAGGPLRRRERVRGHSVATAYQPLVLRGVSVGTLAVSIPVGSAFASVSGAAYRIGLLFALAMLATVALGVALSRYILRSLDPLVATNRSLAAGDLSARAPVLGNDELGEVAEGINQMAAALQASHENLEARVTERTAEVEQRTAEIEQLLRERTAFFTAVSHDLRTPLAVILGEADLLDEPAGRIFREAGNQLLGFVNDILEIARAESGRLNIEPSEVRVPDVFRSIEPTLQALARTNGLHASVKIQRSLPSVLADELRLHQVLLNLVDNAVKYTPKGGRVELAAVSVNSHVELSVTDTGVGIPSDTGGRLFDPFYRVEGTVTQGGQPASGLGLAVVKRLVEAQGAAISYESTPGKGTTFRVSLPTVNTPSRTTRT
jgi:signal transduction histidine kinase